MKEIIRKRDSYIENIEALYRKQVEVLCSAFGFRGNVNVLLSGQSDTKEAKYAKKVRESIEIAKAKSLNIIELLKEFVRICDKIR